MSDRFHLETDFELRGDQPQAIDQLVEGLRRGDTAQGLVGVTGAGQTVTMAHGRPRGDPPPVLLGVPGSGKTFTMAQVLTRVNRPALVMVHNKTLAAQLYQEFRRFFPRHAAPCFVS